jgi:ferredoxin
MSSQALLSRRAFLGFLRRKEEPASSPRPAPAPAVPAPAPGGGFSLEAFYSARAQSGETTGSHLPVFSLREGLIVPQEGVSRVGMAPRPVRIRPQLCLAWQGSFCSTCSERCPVEDAIVIESGRPRVVEARCNGCGLCVQACPAPLDALEFLSSRQQVSDP